ncbi:hypothetical protein B0H14DRAFT_3150412 [Mycena olivaceomarginata]|nr:hypothetical protein B0H14DRAFT_3150412 [Mycena olivaceomarginata]
MGKRGNKCGRDDRPEMKLNIQAPAQPRYDAQQALPFFVAHIAFLDPARAAAIFSRITTLTILRAHLRAPQLGCATPPPPTLPLDAAQLPSYHHRPAQCPRWLFLVGGAAFFFCLLTTTVDASPLRLPGLHSTDEHPHARRPACAALDVVRIQIPKRLSSRTRDVPPRRNYLLMRAIAPPMAYHADTLAIFVPYAAFVCHPRHVPRPHRTPRSFLIAGAAFVGFSYVATTISCPHRTARVARRIPNMTPTSPAPAAAAPPRTPPPSQPSAQNLPPARTTDTTRTPCTSPTHALDRLQRRPTVCSEADATSQREYDAHHHHLPSTTRVRSMCLRCTHPIPSEHRADPRSFPPSHRPSTRASCMRHKDNGSTGPAATILSATACARRVHGRTETARRRRSSSNYVVSGNQDLTAPSPSARHLRLPCGNADSRQAHACERGEGYLAGVLHLRKTRKMIKVTPVAEYWKPRR